MHKTIGAVQRIIIETSGSGCLIHLKKIDFRKVGNIFESFRLAFNWTEKITRKINTE